MKTSVLPEAVKAVVDSGTPACIVSCSKDAVPNASLLSKVHYVGPDRLALSFQFFNKTRKNVLENHNVALLLIDIAGAAVWRLDVVYDHSETEGPVFDELDMQIEAIASVTGMSGIFKLRAADIYRVNSCEKILSPLAAG